MFLTEFCHLWPKEKKQWWCQTSSSMISVNQWGTKITLLHQHSPSRGCLRFWVINPVLTPFRPKTPHPSWEHYLIHPVWMQAQNSGWSGPGDTKHILPGLCSFTPGLVWPNGGWLKIFIITHMIIFFSWYMSCKLQRSSKGRPTRGMLKAALIKSMTNMKGAI